MQHPVLDVVLSKALPYSQIHMFRAGRAIHPVFLLSRTGTSKGLREKLSEAKESVHYLFKLVPKPCYRSDVFKNGSIVWDAVNSYALQNLQIKFVPRRCLWLE